MVVECGGIGGCSVNSGGLSTKALAVDDVVERPVAVRRVQWEKGLQLAEAQESTGGIHH